MTTDVNTEIIFASEHSAQPHKAPTKNEPS